MIHGIRIEYIYLLSYKLTYLTIFPVKILITGGCGFLGSNLAEKVLEEEKNKLYILDNLSRTGSSLNLKWLRSKGNFDFFEKDIRNTEDVNEIIKNASPDVIFHFAGQVAMTTSIENPRADFEINCGGTLNILESVRMFCPECIVIYSSTNKVYGDLEWATYEEHAKRYTATDFPNGFPENIPLSFHSPYGCSKGAADQYVLDYHRIFGLNTVVFRHSSMYGGRQFSTYDQGWIGWFCTKALETKNNVLKDPFTISGNGKQVRDVLYSSDMVDLYYNAIEYAELLKGKAFNIGGGVTNSLSLLELFEILENELNITLKYDIIPIRKSDQKVFIADTSSLSEITGWKPEINKLEGIKKMINWISGNE